MGNKNAAVVKMLTTKLAGTDSKNEMKGLMVDSTKGMPCYMAMSYYGMYVED